MNPAMAFLGIFFNLFFFPPFAWTGSIRARLEGGDSDSPALRGARAGTGGEALPEVSPASRSAPPLAGLSLGKRRQRREAGAGAEAPTGAEAAVPPGMLQPPRNRRVP